MSYCISSLKIASSMTACESTGEHSTDGVGETSPDSESGASELTDSELGGADKNNGSTMVVGTVFAAAMINPMEVREESTDITGGGDVTAPQSECGSGSAIRGSRVLSLVSPSVSLGGDSPIESWNGALCVKSTAVNEVIGSGYTAHLCASSATADGEDDATILVRRMSRAARRRAIFAGIEKSMPTSSLKACRAKRVTVTPESVTAITGGVASVEFGADCGTDGATSSSNEAGATRGVGSAEST